MVWRQWQWQGAILAPCGLCDFLSFGPGILPHLGGTEAVTMVGATLEPHRPAFSSQPGHSRLV